MSEKIEKVKTDIARLEEVMQKDHFGSLVDKGREKKNYSLLKKLRKELKKLEEAG